MTAAVALPLWGTDGDADFPPGSALDRFFAKVEIGDCWLWTGATDRGYGKFYPHGKTVRAHRWLYEQLVGPVPAGLTLDHLCRVRACVNPDHLEVVTQGVNLARSPLVARPGPRRHHHPRTHCRRGHPVSDENTRVRVRDGRPHRECRICHRNRRRAYRKLRREVEQTALADGEAVEIASAPPPCGAAGPRHRPPEIRAGGPQT